MLNTTKLLYILPDVAYVSELIAGKKPHTYGIHAFRQINGEFITKDTLVGKNILKLFSKLEEGEYTLILPDTFFTNTIITVDETNDSKIQAYITEKTLPKLQLTKDTHHIETYVLTEFKGVAQVQIAAVAKKRLAPIRAALEQTSSTLSSIISVSWSIKSLVSLEPSASVIQAGSELFLAKQYIGIDNTTSAPVSDIAVIAENIRSLKGADANLQTVYLICSELVESRLKEELSAIIPLQQLAPSQQADAQMPSYVQHFVEAAGKTLSIKEYPVPHFSPDPASDADLAAHNIDSVIAEKKSIEPPEESDESASEDSPEDENAGEIADDNLPVPTVLAVPATSSAIAAASAAALPEIATLGDEPREAATALDDPNSETSDESPDDSIAAQEKKVPESITEVDDIDADEPAILETTESKSQPKQNEPQESAEKKESVVEEVTAQKKQPTSVEPEESNPDETVDLAKFTKQANSGTTPLPSGEGPIKKVLPRRTEIIKNKGGIQNMLKMIFITTGVFIATVAVGVGVGLGILSLTNKGTSESPVVMATPSPIAEPAPSPSPSPSPAPEIVKENYDILVVNATTKAGYAGTISDTLDDYGTLKAGNARGTYDETGNFVSFKTEVPGLLEALQEDTQLTLTEDAEIAATEDAAGTYDVVIVLAE